MFRWFYRICRFIFNFITRNSTSLFDFLLIVAGLLYVHVLLSTTSYLLYVGAVNYTGCEWIFRTACCGYNIMWFVESYCFFYFAVFVFTEFALYFMFTEIFVDFPRCRRCLYCIVATLPLYDLMTCWWIIFF